MLLGVSYYVYYIKETFDLGRSIEQYRTATPNKIGKEKCDRRREGRILKAKMWRGRDVHVYFNGSFTNPVALQILSDVQEK